LHLVQLRIANISFTATDRYRIGVT